MSRLAVLVVTNEQDVGADFLVRELSERGFDSRPPQLRAGTGMEAEPLARHELALPESNARTEL